MKINKEIISKLNPCKHRFDNFTENYPNFDGDLKDFILLDKITYDDKVWVTTRLFTKEQNVKWALLCATSTLSIFEEKYPDDKRPRLALEAAENWLKNPSATAARAATAADAAATAANVAADADAADAAATAADAAYAAAYAAHDEQKEVNLLFAVEVANEIA